LVIVAKMAAVPHMALPSVNQSAKWNSRIIENGFRGAEAVMGFDPARFSNSS